MPSILYIASEKPRYRDPKGYIGAHGRLLDRMLQQAGLSRDDVEIIWPELWRDGMDDAFDAVVAGGNAAASTVLGWSCNINNYHGSIFPRYADAPVSYEAYCSWLREEPKIVVSWDILQLHNDWSLHPQAMRDWSRAGQIARGTYKAPDPDAREWVVEKSDRLAELLGIPTISFDTEFSESSNAGFATDKQVHVLTHGLHSQALIQEVLQQRDVLKMAHNLQHDLAMCDLRWGFMVKRPYFCTMGGAHLLNTALGKDLSPSLASRFTNWPYHKWLDDVDGVHYNGMDNIVCYDAGVEIIRQLQGRGLWEVALHDHNLLEALYAMQQQGFRIDEAARHRYERETAEELAYAEDRLIDEAAPIIRARIKAFEKPHLFRQDRQCTCCGGGTLSREHCWRCAGLPKKPECKADYLPPSGTSHTVAALRAALPPCASCQASGKVERWNRFQPSSNDHVADVLYRGLRISPRRYKGKETTAAAQLKPLADRYPLVKALVEASVLRADLTTVERLSPGEDGKLHCVLNPWGTESGRVAGSEGLLRPGTNPMNLPKKARRFVVPSDGCMFLYPDMAQVEARAVAVLSGDKGLWQAFTTPIDWPGHPKHGLVNSHTFVQQMISQWVEITYDQSKRTSYAGFYGVSAKQLAVELTAEAMRKGGGTVNEVQATLILEAFFKAFPGVRKWHADVEQQLIRNRTVRSPTGRERHWPGRIMDKDGVVLRETLKEAWSFVPQEIGAHVLALGLEEIHTCHRDLLTPQVHVHDALLLECQEKDVETASQVALRCLSRKLWGMDFLAEMKVGKDWYSAS